MKYRNLCTTVFYPLGSVRPRMYGLPKIHKPDVPLRPILSMRGSAQYDLSKWLCELLKPVEKYYGGRCVKDSFKFSEAVRSARLPTDGYMCSFDVVSLFTNVPLEEVIDICADALFRNDNIDLELTTLTEDSFKELMRLATSGVEFSFNDKIYRQTDGVAMGIATRARTCEHPRWLLWEENTRRGVSENVLSLRWWRFFLLCEPK